MTKKNPLVDAFLNRATTWQKEMQKLRTIVLGCELNEELKWGVPCYTFNDSNVVLIHAFKEYCALLFIKGSLLKDEQAILIRQTSNVQAGRQVRFTSVQQVTKMKAILQSYIAQAIELEKDGVKVAFKGVEEFDIAEEFQHKLHADPALKKAFDALTPGRRKAYLLHFSAPKQSKTREARIEKCVPQIVEGKGLNELTKMSTGKK
jgi:uncharacterized protein YdeI (YjbR/CyaY-like superfamily)